MAFMASNWLQGQSVVLFSSKVHLEGSGNNVIVVPLRVATNGRFLPCGSVFCKYTVKNAVPTMAQDKIPWGAIQDVRKRIFWLVPALKIKYRLLLIADKCGWLRDEYCFRKLVWNWQVFVHSMGWGMVNPSTQRRKGLPQRKNEIGKTSDNTTPNDYSCHYIIICIIIFFFWIWRQRAFAVWAYTQFFLCALNTTITTINNS